MLEDLKKERESLLAQQANALAVYNQATGALAVIDMLLAKIAPPAPVAAEMTEDQLREAIVAGAGGDGK